MNMTEKEVKTLRAYTIVKNYCWQHHPHGNWSICDSENCRMFTRGYCFLHTDGSLEEYIQNNIPKCDHVISNEELEKALYMILTCCCEDAIREKCEKQCIMRKLGNKSCPIWIPEEFKNMLLKKYKAPPARIVKRRNVLYRIFHKQGG